jgi:CRP/FNR family transcriptional regulator, anaerobic regulatory protein
MSAGAGLKLISPPRPGIACADCGLHALCLPLMMSEDELKRLDTLVDTRRLVRRGQTLFRSGDRFDSVYAIRSGFFKTRLASAGGQEQITGFQMAGEVLGLDGISTEVHQCDAVALEDSQVCAIRYGQLETLSREFADLARQFHKVLSREIVNDHGLMRLLSNRRAEQRLAAFLLDLTRRLRSRGFSSSSLILRMTREEIGTYLGLTLETVSRSFSRLHDEGVLRVRRRRIDVLDSVALEHLVTADGSARACPAAALAAS